MAIHPFLNFYELMFISIASLFTVEYIIVWMNPFFFIHIIYYIGFKCGPSTHEGIWLVHDKNFLMFNIFTIL